MDYSKFSNATLAKIATGQQPDYSSMTDDELKEIASSKPAEQPKKEAAPKPVPSASQAALKGAQQGVTAGFADELGGGIQGMMNAAQSAGHKLAPRLVGESPTQVNARLKASGATGDVGPSTSTEMYREGRDENRKEDEEAAKAHPLAHMAGEIGGAALGFKGLGLAARGAGVAIPTLVSAPEGTSAAARLGRVGAHAINAAPVGALYGLGGSNSDLTSGNASDYTKAAKDAANGAVNSTLVGAAIHGGIEGAQALAPSVKNAASGLTPDYLKKLKVDYDFGTNKINPSNQSQQVGSLKNPDSLTNTISSQPTDSAKHVVDLYGKMGSKLGQDVSQAAQNATEAGQNINVSPFLKQSTRNLKQIAQQDPILANSSQFRTISNAIDAIENGNVTPLQAHTLKQQLGNLGAQLSDSQPLLAKEAFNTAAAIREELGTQVPGYDVANQRYNEFAKNLPETLLSKGNPTDISGVRLSDTNNYNNKMLNNLKNMIKGVDEQGNPSSSAKESMTNMLRGLNQFKNSETARVGQAMPGENIPKSIFDEVGVQPEDIENHIKNASFEANALKSSADPTRVTPGGGSLGKVVEYGDAALRKGANMAGQAKAALGYAPNPVLRTSQKIYTASEPELAAFSNKLRQVPGQGQMAASLDKAIKERNTSTKNAILFAIMQNPTLRNLANPEDSGETPRQ